MGLDVTLGEGPRLNLPAYGVDGMMVSAQLLLIARVVLLSVSFKVAGGGATLLHVR